MSVKRGVEVGIIGLGKMGGNLSLQAREKGIRVVGFDVAGFPDHLGAVGVEEADALEKFQMLLSPPRVILAYIPAGPDIDNLVDALAAHLEPGDVLADGGNSYWGDSVRRGERLREKGIHFVDLGTSGGSVGARKGACFMMGGDDVAADLLRPILTALAVEDGFVHAGPTGAGHYVKLVHNGVLFGMLQAIAEGVHMLEAYRDPVSVPDVLECWSKGAVVRSWLVRLMADGYREAKGLDSVTPYVDDTGEVNWLVDDALHMEVPIPVITQSVLQLLASRDERKSWARSLNILRHKFGGHPLGRSSGIAKERREGRVGAFPQAKSYERG